MLANAAWASASESAATMRSKRLPTSSAGRQPKNRSTEALIQQTTPRSSISTWGKIAWSATMRKASSDGPSPMASGRPSEGPPGAVSSCASAG